MQHSLLEIHTYGAAQALPTEPDCSGFIMSVYAHFGYDLPHSSSALRGVGRGVSYAEAQPGDIICYSGHVAIYIGGGAIVHASNERDGIKISSNAAYTTILAVRRGLKKNYIVKNFQIPERKIPDLLRFA